MSNLDLQDVGRRYDLSLKNCFGQRGLMRMEWGHFVSGLVVWLSLGRLVITTAAQKSLHPHTSLRFASPNDVTS